MNSSILKSLKADFISFANPDNSSTVELCLIELSSGNYPKAVDLSEELLKKDLSDSVGWSLKAIAQAHLFDYQANIHLLKSASASIDEFKSKTKFPPKVILNVEAIFATVILDRTVALVAERLNEVQQLRKQAATDKVNSLIAAVGAYASARAAWKTDSGVGKVFGFGAAVAGSTASTDLDNRADLLIEASKGVFGVAIANMATTVELAKALKVNLNELNFEIRTEATVVLQSWIGTLANLYIAVIQNFESYIENVTPSTNIFVNRKLDIQGMVAVVNSPEATQFVYLSKLLGIDKSFPEFEQLEVKLEEFADYKESEMKKDMYIGSYAPYVIGILVFFVLIGISTSIPSDSVQSESSKMLGGILGLFVMVTLFALLFAPLYFLTYPIGTLGVLVREFRQLKVSLQEYKSAVKNVMLENIK